MVDRVVRTAKKVRADAWEGFLKGISITGYKYYAPPPAIKFRFPAPGSCPLDVQDHPNLYKNDWKTPFRMSEYNIQKQEWAEHWDDPAVAERYISKLPYFDPEKRQRAKYDDEHLATMQPSQEWHEEVANSELFTAGAKEELKQIFDALPDTMTDINNMQAPGIYDYDDDYNPTHICWNPRGLGFENNARMKNVFVELEYWIEEVIGKQQIDAGYIKPYKGQPKKWQILDDDCFDREEIKKLQAAADAPMPEQLEEWKEKHDRPLYAPYNNANMAKWRDEPTFVEQNEFDPELLGYDRDQNRKFFLERYEKPKELH